MVTIKDIAKEAGVSHGTVSNVLNKTNKVSIAKIRAVEAAVRKLGYVPNSEAKMLRKGSSGSVVIILPTLDNDCYRNLYEMMRQMLEGAGFIPALCITHDIEGNEEEVLGRIVQSSLSGVVSISCLGDRAASFYSQFTCPVIFLDRKVEDKEDRYGFIGFDLSAAGREIAGSILSAGYSSVAFFSSPSRFRDGSLFFNSLAEALGGKVELVRFTSDISLSVPKAFSILNDMPHLDAVITMSLSRAEAFTGVLGIAGGGRKPAIISLASASAFPNPHFTTYELDYHMAGRAAAEAVISGRKVHTVLPCKGFPFTFSGIEKGEDEKLTLLTISSPSSDALRELLPILRRVTGIDLSIVTVPHEDFMQHVELQSERYHYDLIRFDVALQPEMENGGHLRRLDDLNLDQLLSDRLADYGHRERGDWAVPFEPSSMIMLYRTDLISDALSGRAYYEKYRRRLTAPSTLEEYVDFSRFFTRSMNPDSPVLYGTTVALGSILIAASNFLIFALANNAFSLRPGAIDIDRERLEEAISMFVSIVRCSNPERAAWWTDCVQDFALGRSASVITYSNHVNYLMNSKHSNVVGRIGASVVPGGRTLLGGGMLGISRYSEHVRSCHRFMQWYYSDDIASAATVLGGTTPVRSPYDDPENQVAFPWIATARRSMAIGERGFDGLVGIPIRKFEEVVGSTVQLAAEGQLDPAAAASIMSERLSALLAH